MYIDFDPSDEGSSLGKYLKSLREEKEISIEELAESTKIKQDYLEAIEEDKYDVLPEGPYLMLFLKSYSEALDIEYDKLVSYLEAATAQAPSKPARAKPAAGKSPNEEKPAEESRAQTLKPVVDIHDKRRRQQAERQNGETKKYLMVIGAIVFLAFIAVILFIIFTAQPQPPEPLLDQAETENQLTPAELEQQRLDQFLAQFDELSISIYPASQQGLTFTVDGLARGQILQTPGMIVRDTAEESLYISMLEMDGSRIYLNGYLVILDTLSLVGEHNIVFTKTNWIEFVDTTITETENE